MQPMDGDGMFEIKYALNRVLILDDIMEMGGKDDNIDYGNRIL